MDIAESLAFLQYLYEFTNLSSWHLHKQNWSFKRSYALEIYGTIILVCSSVVMFYGCLTENDFTQAEVNDIGRTVDFLQMVGIRLAHIVSVMETLLRRQEQKKFYEHVKEIDHIFHCKLNVDLNNQKFRQWIMQRGAIMLLIYMLSDVIMLTSKLLTAKSDFFLFWLFYVMPMMICGLRYYQIFTSILIVQRRLNQLIKILNKMKLLQTAATVSTTVAGTATIKTSNHREIISKFPGDGQNQTAISSSPSSSPSSSICICNKNNQNNNINHSVPISLINHNDPHSIILASRQQQQQQPNDIELEIRKLLIIRDIYNRLYKLIKILNRYFGLSMLINVGNDFISITSNCYWIFINFKQYSSTTTELIQTICSTVWTVPHLLNVVVLVIICERTAHCTTDIALMLHRLEYDYTNKHYNSIITQFSLQLLHQKISLTAAGFFNIDCTVLYTIAGATTTYLIILIQFHLNENKFTT